MYRHLLVPLEASNRSVGVVGQAVALAAALRARITFLHADEGSDARDQAPELLAKAEAAARALGVPCESRRGEGAVPAQAITAAAQAAGCDLVYLSAERHAGRGGSPSAPAAHELLERAGVSVLLAGAAEPEAPARAIGIIRDEHRALAAVVHAALQALAESCAASTAVDPVLMRGLVQYLRAFPLAVHHPKEERHLFARLRERAPSLAFELDELARQHERDSAWVAVLAETVERLVAAPQDERIELTRALDAELRRYASFLWEHMGREEGVVLPAAARHLLTEDWEAIDAAFATDDPARTADEGAWRERFARLVRPAVTSG